VPWPGPVSEGRNPQPAVTGLRRVGPTEIPRRSARWVPTEEERHGRRAGLGKGDESTRRPMDAFSRQAIGRVARDAVINIQREGTIYCGPMTQPASSRQAAAGKGIWPEALRREAVWPRASGRSRRPLRALPYKGNPCRRKPERARRVRVRAPTRKNSHVSGHIAGAGLPYSSRRTVRSSQRAHDRRGKSRRALRS
jgi:hypothetical protein